MAVTRRTNQYLQEDSFVAFTHAQVTADTAAAHFWTAPYACKVSGVKYENPTGLATDATHFFVIKIQNASAVCALWSTDTGQEGTLSAATAVSMTLGASADCVLAAGDTLSVVLTEGGTATLPAGFGHVQITRI